MIGSLPPEHLAEVLRSWAWLGLATWLARPLAQKLLGEAGGWIAAGLLAWAAVGWWPWVCAALGLIGFSQASLAGLALLGASRLWIRPLPPGAPSRHALPAALAYLALFWLGLAQRLGKAPLSGLEKFTDMGFLAAAMRSDTMPPQDAWYAGAEINYYYLGQAMTAAWGHLARAAPDHAYQIAMANLFALTGLAVFALTHDLTRSAGPRIAGVLATTASLLTLYGGNLHSALYTLLRPLMQASTPEFYFPDSTRFIGFDPPGPDKGFTEFPAYAFAVGDLHAHVIATPVFLFGLMLLLAILRAGLSAQKVRLGPALALGWVLGLLIGMNAWDVAILGVIALVGAMILLVQRKPRLASRLDTIGFVAITALATAFLTAAPFLGSFHPFAQGIEFAPAQTPLWQLLVIYGAALPAGLLLIVQIAFGRARRDLLLTALMFSAALLLIALPETVIVRDIYGLDYARANTMFKLSFRAQTLLIIAGLASLAPAIAIGRAWFLASLFALAALLAPLAYLPQIATPLSAIRSLDGLAFLGPERGLVEAVRGLPLGPGQSLIEASGDAFGATARVASMTGQPAILGWAGHEWLWRGDPEGVFRRADRIKAFYTEGDSKARCALIRSFGLRYVILGKIERDTYPVLNLPALHALGPVIFRDQGGEIIQIDPDRCPA
jgi:uncharacterized membrane protein